MKKNILPAIRLTVILIIFLAVVYPLTVWSIAQFSSNAGKGRVIESEGKQYYSNIGQAFTSNKYFWSRPSAVDYNAAASGASNLGATNPKHLDEVETRISHFLVHNPDVSKADIPVDLVTASASGLDPNISVEAAKVQVKRIATIRNIEEDVLLSLIDDQTEKPLFGLFGPSKINVLKLNIALDNVENK